MSSTFLSIRPSVCHTRRYVHAAINAFYRGMHMHSADVFIARTMPSQDVRLSVCLYVTRRYSVEAVTHILKLFSPLGSHNITHSS